MQLIELLNKKSMVDTKIKELSSLLERVQDDALAQELYKLLDERQHITINLNKINSTSKMTIGSTEVEVSIAIIIRDNYFGIILGISAIVIFGLAIVFLIYFTIKFFKLNLKIVKERKKEKSENDD